MNGSAPPLAAAAFRARAKGHAMAPPTPVARVRALILVALLLAVTVIGLGAYVRLSDAGLGCPDWPGCYGHYLGVPDSHPELAAAANAFPASPVDPARAWKEMIHRYAAGTLGLLILALAVSAGQARSALPAAVPRVAITLVGLVGLQAALGMWTVTLLLKPVIVTLHLLGGMATLAVLVWLAVRTRPATPHRITARGRWIPPAAVLAIVVQVALGGWVSSNYAALACPDFPTCRGEWRPATDFGPAFTLLRPLGETATGEPLTTEALTAIHLTHRLGAVLVLLLVGGWTAQLLAHQPTRRAGLALGAALSLQILLGIGNVLLQLPLPLAVLHNLGAAALLSTAVAIRAHP